MPPLWTGAKGNLSTDEYGKKGVIESGDPKAKVRDRIVGETRKKSIQEGKGFEEKKWDSQGGGTPSGAAPKKRPANWEMPRNLLQSQAA